ncbi:ribonuclease-like [Pleurodeles waltl]|uniref:ribonuclease-like n=1 Tax=Pleurodeles waltl TaxID=8319 RepID=UPI0037099B04
MSLITVHLLGLLLVVAFVSCADNHCKPPSRETDYQRFLRQHYDNPKSSGGNDYCEKMMLRRCMTNLDPPKKKCKETNSFIHATKKQIQGVCGKGGKPYQNKKDLRVSLQPFSVTTCKNKGDAAVHPCQYKRSSTTRKIVIACRKGFPTHFDEGIVVPK